MSTIRLTVLAFLISLPRVAASQAPPAADPAESALAICAAAATRGDLDAARAAADIAESAFRERIARRDDDVSALVGLARTLGQCRMAGAELMRIGELSAESIELLQRALAVDPQHWLARYVLALNYYRAPAFMGRGQAAARELDLLLAQQGSRTDVAEFARTFEYRGLLWSRAGERDSALVVWRRGLELFPADTALRARVGAADAAPDDQPIAPRTATMQAVTVTASVSTIVARATGSERQLRRSDIVMPAGSTADVFQAIQLQPGATRMGDAVELHTRGGDPAETPIFLDGARVPAMSRFEGLSGGLFAAIDPFVVRQARYSSGGFSVRHGNALSGVLDIETDGRPLESEWRAGLGLGQGALTVRRALGRRSGAWASVRATHAGALLRTHGRSDEFEGSPTSLEGMASFTLHPKPGHELKLVALAERDESARIVDATGFTGPFHSTGANQALVLSTRHLAGRAPVIVRGSAALTSRTNEWAFGVLERDRRERSATVRTDVEYFPAEQLTLRAGTEGGTMSRLQEGRVPVSNTVAPDAPSRVLPGSAEETWMAGAFVEAEWAIAFARILAGTRVDRLPGEHDVTIDPRLSIAARRGVWTARVSGGVFHQGRWRSESAIPDAGTPSGLPREAVHLVAGVEREGALPLRIEAFHKMYGDYRPFGAGPRITDGVARGVEVLLQRPTAERVTGWLAWSYLDSRVTLADGSTARSPFDVTHTGTASATLRLARGTTLGGTARYGTGRPYTPVEGSRQNEQTGRTEPVYGEPTSERMPTYARLDTRLMQFLPIGRSLLAGYVEVINVLDRGNVAGYAWDADYRSRRATSTFYGQRTFVVGFELQSR